LKIGKKVKKKSRKEPMFNKFYLFISLHFPRTKRLAGALIIPKDIKIPRNISTRKRALDLVPPPPPPTSIKHARKK
jgi:hypothetical protein